MRQQSQDWIDARQDALTLARRLARHHPTEAIRFDLRAADAGLRALLSEVASTALRGADFSDMRDTLLTEGVLDEEDIETRRAFRHLDATARTLGGDSLSPMRPPPRILSEVQMGTARAALSLLSRFIEAALAPGAQEIRGRRLVQIGAARLSDALDLPGTTADELARRMPRLHEGVLTALRGGQVFLGLEDRGIEHADIMARRLADLGLAEVLREPVSRIQRAAVMSLLTFRTPEASGDPDPEARFGDFLGDARTILGAVVAAVGLCQSSLSPDTTVVPDLARPL